MTEITKNITVDLSRRGNARAVFARQNDKGSRTLNITLTNGGEPYFVPFGTVATINLLREDGESASFAASVGEDGSIRYTLGLWALSVKGTVRCSISLYGEGERKLTSADFYLDVLDALYSDDDFSEDVDSSAMIALYASIAELEGRLTESLLALKNKHDYDIAALERGDGGGAMGALDFKVVDELPESNMSTNTVYFLRLDSAEENNLFEEYVYTGSTWEKIGTIGINSGNLEKGSGAGAAQSVADKCADGIKFNGKNQNAEDYGIFDEYINDEGDIIVPYGASGDFSASFNGKSAAIGKRSHTEGTTTVAMGAYSHAEGDNSVAYGATSHAEGTQAFAAATSSHAEGARNAIYSGAAAAHAEGAHNIIEGSAPSSHAEGQSNAVTGAYSHAEGIDNVACGVSSHIEGSNNVIEEGAASSHAEGAHNVVEAAAAASHAEGQGNTVSGSYSHVEGNSNTASGGSSHAEGLGNESSGDYSHTEGANNTASGEGSHSEGIGNTASGYSSHAEGLNNTASGGYSHAEGQDSTARGTLAHAEGKGTVAAYISHAEGYGTKATGDYCHSEGQSAEAVGTACHAEGCGTKAGGYYQHVQGRYNIFEAGGRYAHIVGNGENSKNPSNAHTLDWSGNAWYKGNIKVGGTSYAEGKTLATEEFVRQAIAEALANIETVEEYDGTVVLS